MAEEISVVDPVGPEVDRDEDEPSIASKRMKYYERKFSASLYAFNGIHECLRLKLQNACSRKRMEQEAEHEEPAKQGEGNAHGDLTASSIHKEQRSTCHLYAS